MSEQNKISTVTQEQAADIIKRDLLEHLAALGRHPVKGKNFKCVNPAHDDNHPSMGIYVSSDGYPRAHCHACGASYDSFDLIGIEYDLTDKKAIFEKAYDLYGLNVEYPPQKGYKRGYIRYANGDKTFKNRIHNMHNMNTVKTSANKIDFTDFDLTRQNDGSAYVKTSANKIDFTDRISTAHEELSKQSKVIEYLKKRGLTDEIIEAYNIGYSPDGYNNMIEGYGLEESKIRKQNLYKIILPCMNENGRVNYFYSEVIDRRYTDDYTPKYLAIKGVKKPIFNERYIRDGEPVIFVCEGIYDALSVEVAGGKAIALMGIAPNHLKEICEQGSPDTIFIISLDNDDAGKKGADSVKEVLDEMGRDYIVHTSTGGKDFNDALQENPEKFKADIAAAAFQAENSRGEKIAERRDNYLRQNSAYYDLEGFIERISNSATNPPIKTGFEGIDSALDGGLYEGLYIIGAVTSTGKTTLTLQIADNIAKNGRDVLIFSLEMGADELKAKTISRLTLLDCLERQESEKDRNLIELAKTSRGIMTGARYEHYSDDEKNLIFKSIERYGKEYAEQIFIHEGIGDIGADQIKAIVRKHKEVMGNAPVVIVDYLQILAPYDIRATDKQNTDKAVLELKRLSRDIHTTVFCVSSLNRSGYKGAVTLADFKESGAIEYGADVLLGIYFTGADRDNFDISKAKQESPRQMTLSILKNRNGRTGNTINFSYHTLFNYFVEK